MFSGENLVIFIKAIGYLGVFGCVFAESGLLVGFFLPGDSLLFTAEFLASQGYLNLSILIFIIFSGAVLGDNVGYTFGKKVGPALFRKEDSRLFHKDNLLKAEKFYEEHGPKTVVLAKFIPFVRTFMPILAGVGKMKYKTFLTYDLAGSLFWAVSLPFAGFYLGKIIPNIDHYILPIIGLIILFSLMPPVIGYLKNKNRRNGQ